MHCKNLRTSVSQYLPQKAQVGSDTEINSKIEQNKLLINKVQKVLDIIKFGVQFAKPSSLDENIKIEEDVPDVIYMEAQSEVETAVNLYDEEEEIEVNESKSDINMAVGAISCDQFQQEALRAKAAKSNAQTAIRDAIGETTSDDTFKPPSMTDDDLADDDELAKLEEIVKRKEIEDLQSTDIYHNRPLTRRCEEKTPLDDKFRTEPISSKSYPVQMSDIDILQAKLSAIHDTESESATEETYTKANSTNGELSDAPTHSVLSLDLSDTPQQDLATCENRHELNLTRGLPEKITGSRSSENIKNSNVKQKLPEKASSFVADTKSSNIRKDCSFKSSIIDKTAKNKASSNVGDTRKNLNNRSDVRKEFMFKSKLMTKIPQFVGDSKRPKIHASKISNKCDSSTNNKIYTNCSCSTEPTDLQLQSTESKDVASNTERSPKTIDFASNTESPAERKDIASSTEDYSQSKDFASNTEGPHETKDCTSNTDRRCDLRDTASITEGAGERTNIATNTECKRKDFASYTRPHQKDFTCKVELRSRCKNVTCETDGLKIKTSDVSCCTDIDSVSAATQKDKLDGTNMTFTCIENVDIPTNNHLKKSNTLQCQLLPPINIVSHPTVQRVLHFYIDQNGLSHVAYQPSDKKIGYIEIESASYDKLSEVNTMVTSNFESNYEEGFTETRKEKPARAMRKPKQKCKFFIGHKYNQYCDSGSEKMLNKTMNVLHTREKQECATSSCDDGELIMEQASSCETQFCKDVRWLCLRENGTYVDINCSDSSSLAFKTIKEVSAHPLRSDSDTISPIGSIYGSNELYSATNIHSSGQSSRWVGEFMNKNIDENVYKTFIDPEGYSRREGLWKHTTKKTKVDGSLDTRDQNKPKTIETQTTPSDLKKASPERVTLKSSSESIKLISEKVQTSAPVSDTILVRPPSVTTHSPNPSTAEHVLVQTPRSVFLPVDATIQTMIPSPVECSPLKKSVGNTSNGNQIQSSVEISIRKEVVETPNPTSLTSPTFPETGAQVKILNPDVSETDKLSPSLPLIPKEQSSFWDKISLTVTCSTDGDSSAKTLSNTLNSQYRRSPKKYIPACDEMSRSPRCKVRKEDEKSYATENNTSVPPDVVNQSKILKTVNKEVTPKERRRAAEQGNLTEEKDKKKKEKVLRLEQKYKKKYPRLEERTIKNKRKKDETSLQQVMEMCGDFTLIEKQRKKQEPSTSRSGRRKNEDPRVCDDVFSKFRNMYLVETDATTDTTTTERSYSEGEVKGRYSTSSGEIQTCKRDNRYQHCKKPHSFQKDIGITPIRKRRHYFNNWITYYFNKNPLVNDSSSTS